MPRIASTVLAGAHCPLAPADSFSPGGGDAASRSGPAGTVKPARSMAEMIFRRSSRDSSKQTPASTASRDTRTDCTPGRAERAAETLATHFWQLMP